MASVSGLLRINPEPKLYRQAVIISMIPLILAGLLAIAGLLFGGIGIHFGTHTLPFWLLLILVTAPYYLASTYVISANEFYCVYIFEKPTIEGRGGIKFVPAIAGRLERFPRGEQEAQFPGEPEEISHVPDDVAAQMRPKLLNPIRITTGGPEQGECAEALKDNIMNEQLTFEPTFTVFWQVELDEDASDDREGVFEFSINIPGKDWPAKLLTIIKQMRDTGEQALAEIMGRHSAAWCIVYRAELAEHVQKRISAEVAQWGINICRVGVQNLTGSHEVNIALGKIPAAKANAQATVIGAQAEKNRLITESEGQAQAEINTGTAKGQAIAAAAKAIGVDGKEYWQGELGPQILGDKAVIIGDDGIAKALAIGAKVVGAVK